MPRKNSTQAPHGGRGDHARRRRSKWSFAVIGGPVILAVVAGSVFAAGGRHHDRGQGNGGGAAQAATPDPNCTLVVPEHPLSARGLATPYKLVATDPAKGPCHEANPDQAAFVEAAILTKDGRLSVYDPLVIDKGTRPAAPTVRPKVPTGSTVGIWFGFNSAELRLKSSGHYDSLAQGKCVNGVPGSVFGQFAYCNAPAFFRAAKTGTAKKHLKIPALGTAKDGSPCPTTRDFSVVDQDGSDNVVTRYLADANGRIAQDNAASRASLRNGVRLDTPRYGHHRHGGKAGPSAGAQPKVLTNGSDNLLLTHFIDPALGCKPFTVPNQSGDNLASSALPLDEWSAAARQRAPIALVPQNDPMTLVDGRTSVRKTNAYRVGVDMPRVGAGSDGNGAAFCRTLFGDGAGVQRVFRDKALLKTAPSPDPGTAPNLFGFLAARANQTFTNLGCDRLLHVGDPVILTTDGNGLVVDAVLTRLGRTPPPSGGPTNGASPSVTPSASSPVTDAPSATPSTAATSSSPPPVANGGSAEPSSGAPTPSMTTGAPSASASVND
ncbi:hypothetical protein ACIBL8_06905 [Streptomyces sp. NPDC050523]|uniref:hypothetical protein n=1 Tax=Streptomyces sp. NPDC050523 TaxID=3365622 RepID=UPI0037B272EB